MIDWSKLKPYQGYRWKSFEEFCYSIAKRLYHDEGNFTPIDDSGGGDGVEFYLTMPDGTEWGWQARFYYPDPRLRKSGRKKSIKRSLERAIKNHKRLKKWFLCTPTNFTTVEIAWFDKLQQRYPNMILEHWGDSEFNDFLTNSLWVGIKNYYFGELELGVDWFRAQVVKQVTNVGNKFIPNLHTETPVDSYIHVLLGDSVFVQHLEEQIASFREHVAQYDEAIERLHDTDTRFDWQDIKIKLLAFSAQLRTSFIQINEAIVETRNYLSLGQFEKIGRVDWDLMERELRERLDFYFQTARKFYPEKLSHRGIDEEEAQRVGEYLRKEIMTPFYVAKEITDLFYVLKSNIETARLQELHIFGGAGIGKTHIACHISQERISKGLPAILLLGKHFTNALPIENQILKILGIPTSYSWKDFIEALQSAAEVYKTKIPIVIDALNEAQVVDKWKRELPGFAYALTNLPQVVLMTTCRSNYRQEVWQSTEPSNSIEAYGFGSDSLEEAIAKYFDWYKIKCDLTLGPLKQFSHPIFLKIFCESQNRQRKEEKQIYLGEQTLLQVFEEYVTKCNEAVCSKISKHPSTHIVQNALRELAKELWERKSRYVPLSDAVKLIDSKDMKHVDWTNSITYAILDEGLLINRDLINRQDVVLFAYGLLGGYIIAKEIISGFTPQKIEEFVKSQKFKNYLLSDNFSDKHPLHEDILRCVALLLPMRFGIHLYQLIDDKTALNRSIHALFEIAPEFVDNSSKDLITKLFSHSENRKPLLRLAKTTIFHVEHPLNIEFWDKLLLELPMSERDLCWTEFLRRNPSMFFSDLDKFESACKGPTNLTGVSTQRLLLAARYFRWLLTSTVRTLRDTATRALYWYGRQFPNRFFDLVLSSLAINDPYVPERMLAAAYGVAMALQSDFQRSEFREKILPRNAKNLYESMFKLNAPHATTHILSRDYAKRLIEIALIHKPTILTTAEKQRITPPFTDGGIRNWGESEERDEDSYREGSMPIHTDFGNYTLGSLVPKRLNYDFSHEGYKKVRANIIWRLYDLGYSHDWFKEIDKEIHRHNWRFGRAANGGKIDRYGKKYSWIAFYELAGFRHDNDLLREYISDEPRILYADIDPSFPEPIRECEVISTDYLGDRTVNLSEWIENGGVPDISQYLIIGKLCDERGPWVLMDGDINQEDLEAKRALVIFPRGLLVKKDAASNMVECLKNQNLAWRLLPDIAEDHYTFAGEIPWCETFPYNDKIKMEFLVGSRIEQIPEKKVARLKDGTLLNIDELLELVREKIGNQPQTSEDSMGTILDEEGIELIETTTYVDKEVEETVSYEVLIPVRYYNWEGYFSKVNKASPVMVPAKELAECLDLCSQPQTFNLYEKNGKLATMTVRWGESWYTGHHLIYIRKDLLERYLEENDAELVWAIWGERRFRSKSLGELEEFSKEHGSAKPFQVIKKFAPD